jgi:proteasome accessory factor B
MRRVERLINLIAALLEARVPMTAEEIRTRIAGYDQESRDAFRRTFERDKEALRAMGIPIEIHQTDPFGSNSEGYLIPKARYRLPELDLEADEFAALSIAAEAILGAAEAAKAGLMKLSVDSQTVPSSGPRVVWGADLAAEQPLLAPLYSAQLDSKPVTFSYRRTGSDEAETREVEPYSLLHRRGHWYLVGRDRKRDAIRAFKVSRIEGTVQTLSGSYEVPEGFEPAAHVAGDPLDAGGAEPATALVRFSADLRWWAEQNLPSAPARESPGGALDVEMPIAGTASLVSWAVGFGSDIEILEPESARRALIEHLAPFLEEP